MSIPLPTIPPASCDPLTGGAKNTGNANKISASAPLCAILETMVENGTNKVGTPSNDIIADVKNHSVASDFEDFLEKCAKVFRKIGSLLNLFDSRKSGTARKSTKAIKQEAEEPLQYFRNEYTIRLSKKI